MQRRFWITVFIASLKLYSVLGAPNFLRDCTSAKCINNGMMNYYKELNCMPVLGDDPCCPIRYDCSILAGRSSNKCYHHGMEYKLKSEVSMSASNKCLANCKCRSVGNKAEFDCAIVECPEDLIPPTDRDCKPRYTKDFCCSTSTVCLNNKTEVDGKKLFECAANGLTYYEGERFFPDGECKICHCMPGFDGTTNRPWCEDISCNPELRAGNVISKGCAPVFYSPYSMCCPMEWKCPSDEDVIIRDPDQDADSDAGDSDGCLFGKLKMSLHDKLVLKDPMKTECMCILPPHITCIMTV